MFMSKKTISILGCGWLGLPLGKHLVNNGYSVRGSTTTKDKLRLLIESGIEPYLIDLNNFDGNASGDFFKTEILLINIPPGKTAVDCSYVEQIKKLESYFAGGKVKKILFVSSTSVYGNANREIDEENELTPETSAGKVLAAVEKYLVGQPNIKATILRFGGLIGPNRNPAKYFAGKKNIPEGAVPVNLIHLDDCIGIVSEIIISDSWNQVFNACAEMHPTRAEYYKKACVRLGLPEPSFINERNNFKIISSKKIKNKLNYTFKYPDPLGFPVDL